MLGQHLTPYGFDVRFNIWSERVDIESGGESVGGRGWGLAFFDARSRESQIEQGYGHDDLLEPRHDHRQRHFGAPIATAPRLCQCDSRSCGVRSRGRPVP